MPYQDHYMTCDYCRNNYVAGRYEFSTESGMLLCQGKKLSELSAIIKGVSYPSITIVGDAKAAKLKELGRMND